MRLRSIVLATATIAALAAAPGLPGHAQAGASISVSPTTAHPEETVTVSGTSDCPSVAYTVTLSYVNADREADTATATGTTDAAGEFTQALTFPADSYAGEPATVVASVDCSGGTQQSNVVDVLIDPYLGTFAIDPLQGDPGTEVAISGANCWGGRVMVGFGDGDGFEYLVDVEGVVLLPDRTFSGTFTIPNRPAGPHAFVAECPGSDFELAPFRVLGGEVDDDEDDDDGGDPGVPAAPPAGPVPGTPTFTG